MKYRRKSRLMHTDYDKPDAIYWSANDTDYTGTTASTRRMSSIASNRKYIDPWDLENYEYIQRNMEGPPELDQSTPSPAGEPISSTFYYMPGPETQIDNSRTGGCYAGMDEQTFYNSIKYDSIGHDDFFYDGQSDVESLSSDNQNICNEGRTMSTLQLHTPGFGVASGRRSLVLPKPIPHIDFPAPPPTSKPHLQYPKIDDDILPDDYYVSSLGARSQLFIEDPPYCTLNTSPSSTSCYECVSIMPDQVPIYASKRSYREDSHNHIRRNRGDSLSTASSSSGLNSSYNSDYMGYQTNQKDENRYNRQYTGTLYPPQHFGLSKKGLLQIDYSCNWNNLHRYITQ